MKYFVEIPEIWATEFLEHDVHCHGYWVSSLTQSWQKGYADNCTLSWTNYVDITRRLRYHTDKPIYVDVDMLFNEPNIGAVIAKELESVGCSGVVIESKRFPKVNSLTPNHMVLSSPDEFCRLINKVKTSVPSLQVFARIEYLATTHDPKLTEEIALRSIEAGADGVVIHWGKNDETTLLKETLQNLKKKSVLTGVIPTKYFNQVLNNEFDGLADFSILGNICSSYIRHMFGKQSVLELMKMPSLFAPILERSDALAPTGMNTLLVLGAKPDKKGKRWLEDPQVIDQIMAVQGQFYNVVLVVDKKTEIKHEIGQTLKIIRLDNSIGEIDSIHAARKYLNTEHTTIIYADIDWENIILNDNEGMQFKDDLFLGVLKDKTDKILQGLERIDPTCTLIELGGKCNTKILTV